MLTQTLESPLQDPLAQWDPSVLVDFQASEFLALQATQATRALKVPAARKAILITWEVKGPLDPVRRVLQVLVPLHETIITDNLLALLS